MQPSKKYKQHRLRTYPGNIRLFLGLFRTPTKQEEYIRKSLARKLP